MANYNYLYDPEYQKYLAMLQQQNIPDYQLNTPSLSSNNMAAMNTGNTNIMANTPKTVKTGWDPWSIGMAAASVAAPMGASLLGRTPRQIPGAAGGAGLGMTRGAEVPNVYTGRQNPIIQALLARYLGRR